MPEERLLIALTSPKAAVRAAAAEVLKSHITSRRVRSFLIKALHDREAAVRAAAAESLGRSRDRRVARSLFRLVEDASHRVQFAAARALANTGGPSALPILTQLLSHRSRKIRNAAEWAATRILLERSGPTIRTIAPLLAVLQHGDSDARRRAHVLLEACAQRMFHQEPSIKSAVMRAAGD
ncbi:MAG: HEAT repeat domain-containing protein [Vicinamibacteria bacterium]|nr:HEAT repeat domain-containing protein [Vicinamibacteria bacterium]